MITLADTTGHEAVDAIIAAIIGIYESAFPDRIRGYYIVGSYSDNSPVSTSDIDMEIIFKGTISPEENTRQQAIKTSLRTISPIHLDLPVHAEATLHEIDTTAVKFASLFIYGEDTRELMPVPSMDLYLRRISIPTHRGLTYRFRTNTVQLPLAYPLPDDDFYGYLPARYNTKYRDIKLWVLSVGWMATFLIAKLGQVFVPSKRHMLPLYRNHVNDQWTDFVTQVYENGREKWQYMFPEHDTAIVQLHKLCQQTLAFENYVAEAYVAFLNDQKAQGETTFAQERLQAFHLT